LNPLLTKKTFKKAIWRNKKCAQENEIKLGNSAQHVAQYWQQNFNVLC